MRSLRYAPAFAATAVLTLAIGIGSVVAMCSVYWRVVLNPVSAPEPQTLVAISGVNRRTAFVPPALSWPRVLHLQQHAEAFSSIGAYSNDSVTLGAEDLPPEDLRGLRVSAGFFETLRVAPLRGRVFSAAEDLPNGAAVCIVSYELWQARFA